MARISDSERKVHIAVAILRREGGFEAASDLLKLNLPDRLSVAKAIVDNHPTKGQGYLEIINLPPARAPVAVPLPFFPSGIGPKPIAVWDIP